MHTDIPVLDRQGLRDFGLTTGVIIAVLFGLFLPWLFGFAYPAFPFGIPWIIAAVLIVWALVHPDSLNPVYRTWMRIGMMIGAVMSRVILSIVFYLLFTPFGFVMRLTGYRPMREKLEPDAKSYRVTSRPSPPHKMERPF